MTKNYSTPGVYDEKITFPGPQQGLLKIEMVNNQAQHFEDSISVGYNTEFFAPLKWILVVPLTVSVTPLLWMKRTSSRPLPA
ncbi:unnamed protein product [Choristocarpus tenellus]